MIELNDFDLSQEEEIVVEMLNKIRGDVFKFLEKKDVVGFNPFGETSRGFDEEISAASIRKLRELGFRGTIVTEEKISWGGENYIIYIDPIDGSLNASRSIPIYCYEVGLFSRSNENNSGGIMGVIWDIPRDNYYIAMRGRGVYKIVNGELKNLKPRRWDFNDTLIDAVNTSGGTLDMLKKVGTTRQFGSIAFSITGLLEGKIDAIFDMTGKLKFTDIAGGKVLLNEAKVNHKVLFFDEEINPRSGIIASTDRNLFNKLVELEESEKG
ncbi:MAG: inositol monophosphatase family protein [Candidatus Njordarchaeia archaeon]